MSRFFFSAMLLLILNTNALSYLNDNEQSFIHKINPDFYDLPPIEIEIAEEFTLGVNYFEDVNIMGYKHSGKYFYFADWISLEYFLSEFYNVSPKEILKIYKVKSLKGNITHNDVINSAKAMYQTELRMYQSLKYETNQVIIRGQLKSAFVIGNLRSHFLKQAKLHSFLFAFLSQDIPAIGFTGILEKLRSETHTLQFIPEDLIGVSGDITYIESSSMNLEYYFIINEEEMDGLNSAFISGAIASKKMFYTTTPMILMNISKGALKEFRLLIEYGYRILKYSSKHESLIQYELLPPIHLKKIPFYNVGFIGSNIKKMLLELYDNYFFLKSINAEIEQKLLNRIDTDL